MRPSNSRPAWSAPDEPGLGAILRDQCASENVAFFLKQWGGISGRCAGRIDSVVELLRGRLSETVLEALVDRRAGLFPAPREIDFTCSCPDYASLCKHIAAVLYGVGARLDKKPELFFTLRSVALEELVAKSALRRAGPAEDALDSRALEGIFGIELDRGSRRRRR